MNFRQPFYGEWPITQEYGEAITSKFHTGIDYGCPMGTAILASASGYIRFAGFDQTGYGYCMIIEHDISHATLYAHLSFIRFTNVGRRVEQGEVIGFSGNSGNSTGPHLHFEARTRWNDYLSHFDPMKLPLMSVDDTIIKDEDPVTDAGESKFLEAEDLGSDVIVTAPAGVFGHNAEFTSKKIFPYGTRFTFTGNTVKRNGLTFCECQDTVWIAVHDYDTQLLSNQN